MNSNKVMQLVNIDKTKYMVTSRNTENEGNKNIRIRDEVIVKFLKK